MREKQKKLLDKLKSSLEGESRYLGLIIIGSLATGNSREESDIDLCLVATDEEFQKITEKKDYYFGNTGAFEDEEIGIDGKIINLQFLKDASKSGNEPVRESFRDAFTLFDHTGIISSLIEQILIYPEEERIGKLKRFYSLFECNQYYATQSLSLKDDYLKSRCITESVYYASRLVLCYNRIYFPCHKSMFNALIKAKNIPDNFIELSKDLLKEATVEKLDNYFDLVYEFSKDLNMNLQESVGLILEDEWTWFTGKVPIGCL